MKNANVRMDRRAVMKSAAIKVAAAAPYFVSSRVFAGPGRVAPSDRIEIAVIGIGVRGKYLISSLPENVQVTALCDCSTEQIESARKPEGVFRELLTSFLSSGGDRCAVYQDYRELFSQHSCDAAIIATSDHHHALASILAMKAGCDVYVEKPLAVTIAEGRAIVDAAKRYDRIVQVGSQQRSMKVNQTACEFVRDGGLGRVHLVEERNFPGPMPYEPEMFSEEFVPASMNWDCFCGPTPTLPYHRRLWMKDAFKYGYLTWRGWDLFEAFSGHLMTNWGAHSLDMIQYALGMDDGGPTDVTPHFDQVDATTDDQWHQKTPPLGEVKNHQRDRRRFTPVSMRYDNGVVLQLKPQVSQTVFHGQHGRLYLSRNHYRTEPDGLLPPVDAAEVARWSGSGGGSVAGPHLQDWLDAVRHRGSVHAPPEIGHRSASVCHLANIARVLGRPVRWNPRTEKFIDDPQADQHLSRLRRDGFQLPA
tara:strand:+ start:526263 stop:527690 length:1428 start_codon:yes stop_codon:yes gene_type:complete